MNIYKKLRIQFGTVALVTSMGTFMCSLAHADPVRHTDWCFESQTNNRLVDQPMDKGNCAALLAAGAAASYFSGNAQLGSLVLSSRQNEWANAAATLACTPGAMNNQYAIRLIQACQCHNTGAQNEIENNQDVVISTLRKHGGCN
jgi:hypothetical protein